MPTTIVDDLDHRDFYHGTFWHNAESILAEGFRDRMTLEGEVFRLWGTLGYGVYITRSFATSMFFANGGVVLRVRLQPGTRILAAVEPADRSVIAALKREFGAEIVRRPPWLVLPRNKHLKLHEAIALYLHHFHRWRGRKRPDRKEDLHWRLMLAMQHTLRRYGLHGVGDPEEDMGIVVFGRERVVPVGLVSPGDVDAATLRRLRADTTDGSFRQWLSNCRSPEFAELARRAALRRGQG